MNVWKDNNIAEKVLDILKNVKYKDEEHHLGNPYLTSYQIAIEFLDTHRDIVKDLPYHSKVGGKDLGEKGSLAQYFGRQLSRHCDEMKKLGIEGGFLSGEYLVNLEFEDDVKVSVKDVCMFRYNADLISEKYKE